MFTKRDVGKSLKKMAKERQDRIEIACWSFEAYIDWPDTKDKKFLSLLISLSYMELGEEFFISYEKIEGIANDIIAGCS